MAILGTIILEDQTLQFQTVNHEDQETGNLRLTVTYTIIDQHGGFCETQDVPMDAFFKALSIALHPAGMPDHARDYPAAESVQPVNPDLRWIP